jgi:3-oxoacyl-ACP reductase-like protein
VQLAKAERSDPALCCRFWQLGPGHSRQTMAFAAEAAQRVEAAVGSQAHPHHFLSTDRPFLDRLRAADIGNVQAQVFGSSSTPPAASALAGRQSASASD